MNRIKYTYLTPVLLTAALTVLGSCSRTEEPAPSTPSTDALALNIRYTAFDVEQTKAEAVSADSLFAYPFNAGTQAPVTPVKNDSRADGVYYFTIPSDATGIFFTTASAYGPGLKVRSAMPDTLLTIETEPGCSAGQDILYGGIAEYTGAPEESIAMTHAVARIRAVLKLIVGEDTVTNLTGYFDTVSVAVSGVASGIAFGSDFSSTYLETGNTISAAMNITGTSCHSDYVYTFPTPGPAPALELRTVISGSGEATFRTPLPSPLEAGSDYTITIYLHKDNTDAGFTMGEITFNEEFIEQDFHDNDFGLVTFSRNTLLFPVEERASEDLIVNSRLGTWRASISTDVLSAYSVENLSTGETASGISPSLTGSSGDTVRFTTLRDLTGSSTSIMEVTFKAEDVNNYPVTLMQSNGVEQKISFHKSSSGYYEPFIMSGYCTLYRIDDSGDSTEIFSVTSAERYGHYESLPSGDYIVTGDIILGIETELISDITFENCTTLQDLNIDRSSLQNLDLQNLPSLANFDMYDNSDLTALDFSGCPGLTTIELRDITAITDIDLSGCSSLERFSSDDMPLASLSLSGCSSLKEFDVYLRNSTITSMDFSKSPLLSSLYIRSYSNSNTLRYLNIDGCTSIADLYLDELDKLKELDASKASVTEARIYNADSLTVLNFASNAALNNLYISNCYYLESVNLSGCTALKELPYVWSSSLTELNLSKSGIETLDINTSNLTDFRVDSSALRRFVYTSSAIKQDSLDFSGCASLDSVYISGDNRTTSTTTIVLDGCTSISGVDIIQLPNLTDMSVENASIKRLYMDWCSGISTLSLEDSDIKEVRIGMEGALEKLSYISFANSTIEKLYASNLEQLSRLSVAGCESLNLIDLTDCYNLYFFYTEGCGNITNIRLWNNNQSGRLPVFDFSRFPNLQHLLLNNIDEFKRLDLRPLTQLRFMNIANIDLSCINCQGLTQLNELHLNQPSTPDSLILNGCSSLPSLDLNSSTIRYIDLDGASSLSALSISNSDYLDSLNLTLPALESLKLEYIDNLEAINITEGSRLRKVSIDNCWNLNIGASDLNAEQTLRHLFVQNSGGNRTDSTDIDLSGYQVLDTLVLRSCYKARSLNLSNCTSLSLIDLDNSKLVTLSIEGCESLMQADLAYNLFNVDALNLFFGQLPQRNFDSPAQYRLDGCPGDGNSNLNTSVADEKFWSPTPNNIGSDINE